jgi:hypothetical protein
MTAKVGDLVNYTIAVRNTGQVDAPKVVLVAASAGQPQLCSAHPSQGRCRGGLPSSVDSARSRPGT